jgi:hypothetical protein
VDIVIHYFNLVKQFLNFSLIWNYVILDLCIERYMLKLLLNHKWVFRWCHNVRAERNLRLDFLKNLIVFPSDKNCIQPLQSPTFVLLSGYRSIDYNHIHILSSLSSFSWLIEFWYIRHPDLHYYYSYTIV